MSTVKSSFQTTFLSILILTSLFAFVTPFQNSFESSYTIQNPVPNPTLTFRDITNTSPIVNATISFDKSNYQTGDTAIITVTDSNANVNINAIDFTSAIVTMSSSTTITLTETSSTSGIFTGTFVVDAPPSVDYTQDSPESARAQTTLLFLPTGASPCGSVQLSDASFTENELVNLGIKPVTGALEITFSGCIGLAALPTVEISYANANLDGGNINHLEMWHKAPGQSWEKITSNNEACGFCGTFLDTVAQTMESDPSGPGFVGTSGEGQYVLAFDTGIPGGGGGGLVRPGLVVNALAGLSSLGGGSSGPPGPTVTLGAVALSNSGSETISMPQEIRDFLNNDFDPNTPLEPITDTYENFDLPLSINGNGFALGGYENTLVTQTIESGVPNEFNIVFYTNSEIAHTSLNFNLGPTKTITGSDTQILLYKDKPIEIIDPNGNIATATGIINNDGELKRVATFSITFSEDMQWSNSDLVIRAWNDNLNSGDTLVYNAIQIAPSEEEIAFEENIPEPEIEQLKSQHVPIWIKNNANWWSQELIEDADFVAGLEYLIQNNIVTIPDSELSVNEITTQQIPSWIKNTAGWWSEDQITEKEFIDGLQWLISNGIIQVAET